MNDAYSALAGLGPALRTRVVVTFINEQGLRWAALIPNCKKAELRLGYHACQLIGICVGTLQCLARDSPSKEAGAERGLLPARTLSRQCILAMPA